MGNVARLCIALIVMVVSRVVSDDDPSVPGPAWVSASHRTAETRRDRSVRVIAYMKDVTEELDDAQLQQVTELCAGHGYTLIAVVQEKPGAISGLIDALRMVADGEADRIVMASRDLLPGLIESASGEHPGPDAPGHHRRTPRHRRTRPMRRGGGGA